MKAFVMVPTVPTCDPDKHEWEKWIAVPQLLHFTLEPITVPALKTKTVCMKCGEEKPDDPD